ncbi:MAG: hypothetical protein K2M95_04190, partial [Clostridiales bacterium]|nr:hypothetical protein [Clostridiales bacterium]
TVTPKTNTKGGTVALVFYVKVVNGAYAGTEWKESATLTVEAEKEYTGISVSESPAYTYTVSATGDGTATLNYKMVVLSGSDLIGESNSELNLYKNYSTTSKFTVTPKDDTLGGTVVLVFYVKVVSGAYAGTEWQEVKTITVPPAEKPNVTLTVTGTTNKVANVTESNGYTCTASYVENQYVTVGANGRITCKAGYEFTTSSDADAIAVTVTAIVTITDGPYSGTKETKTFTVYVKAIASDEEVSA